MLHSKIVLACLNSAILFMSSAFWSSLSTSWAFWNCSAEELCSFFAASSKAADGEFRVSAKFVTAPYSSTDFRTNDRTFHLHGMSLQETSLTPRRSETLWPRFGRGHYYKYCVYELSFCRQLYVKVDLQNSRLQSVCLVFITLLLKHFLLKVVLSIPRSYTFLVH